MLLVSVRNATEAAAALIGGCDILDIKEPTRGPLGMADLAAIRAIVATRDDAAASVPVSVALGELRDWPDYRPAPQLGTGISFLKFGTSRLQGEDLSRQFGCFRERFPQAPRVGWIPVAYADWQAAEAPHPRDVARAAVEASCDGLLIDTFGKAGGGLFEFLSEKELNECAAIVHRAGRMTAFAGRLGLPDIARTLPFAPDILGIRSAACRDGRRELEVDGRAVEQFRRAIAKAATRPGDRITPRRPVSTLPFLFPEGN